MTHIEKAADIIKRIALLSMLHNINLSNKRLGRELHRSKTTISLALDGKRPVVLARIEKLVSRYETRKVVM